MLLKYHILVILFFNLMLTACGRSSVDFYPHVSTPYNLTASTISADSIQLSWDYDGPSDFTQQFYIYQDGVKTYSTRSTSVSIGGLLPNTQYCFFVTSKNIWYESSASNTSCATTNTDTSSPYTFNANLVARLASASEANLRWNQYFDNVGVAGYKVYRDNTYYSTVYDLTLTDNSLSAATEYCYHVIAYDSSGNEATPTNTSCVDTSWKVNDVDASIQTAGLFSISVDSSTFAHIAFYDKDSGYLRYANNTSGNWVFTDIDYTESSGYQYMSIDIDSNDNAHIAYHDPINGVLKYTNNTSGSWVSSVIDNTTISGRYVSMALDNNDKLHISYYTGGTVNYITNVTGNWIKESVDSRPGHSISSIDVSPNGYIHIAYSDFINKHIVYATNMSGSWVTTDLTSIQGNLSNSSSSLAVDQNDKAHMCFSGGYLTNLSGSWVSNSAASGSYCSIALSPDGKVHISHQIEYSRTINQVSYSYTELTYTTNKDGSWKSFILDDSISGFYSSLALDKNNDAHIINLKVSGYLLRYATNK